MCCAGPCGSPRREPRFPVRPRPQTAAASKGRLSCLKAWETSFYYSDIQLAHVLRIQPESFHGVHVELLLLDEIVLESRGGAQNRPVIHHTPAHHRRVALAIRSLHHILHIDRKSTR